MVNKPEQEKDKAIIIETRRYGEADKIITLFTKRFGKIKAIVKKIRTQRHRYAATAEIGQIAEVFMLFYPKKNYLCRITNIKVIKPFFLLNPTVEHLMSLHYILSILSEGVPFNDPNPEIFDLLYLTIKKLYDAKKEDIRHIIRTYELSFINKLGILPSIEFCSKCWQPINSNAYLSFSLKNIVCDSCSRASDLKITSSFISLYKSIKQDCTDLKIDYTTDLTARLFFRHIFQSYTGKPMKILNVRKNLKIQNK